jgi:hypothetical protein
MLLAYWLKKIDKCSLHLAMSLLLYKVEKNIITTKYF